jgi:uncharacterized protein YcfJ
MRGVRATTLAIVTAAVLLTGCATTPYGPSAMVLPGTGKSFDAFRADDGDCRQFAVVQSGGETPDGAAVDSGVRSAALGTAIGGVAGAALGGGHGAAAGAGAGLVIGGLAGTAAGSQSAYTVQRRYDVAYEQCMYAKGNRIPVSGRFESRAGARPAPSAAVAPPPPPAPRAYRY